MQDKQNKGIGAYKDRPGYFLGGMIGGAILGALVNKMQGKDWKRGAMWGGIGGGLGSWATKSFMPAGAAVKGTAAYTELPWYQKMLSTLGTSMGKYAEHVPTVVGGLTGLGTSYVAGDPEWEKEKMRDWRRQQFMEQYKRNKSMYDKWYTNPFTGEEMNPNLGWNTGGIINARPGYQYGGSSTLEYTDPDLYTPTGEGGGPSSRPIQQIPLGPEPSFTDEFEELEMGAMNPEIQKLYRAFLVANQATEEEVPIEMFMQLMQQQGGGGQGPMMAAEGGYKTRPQYRNAGNVEGYQYDVEKDNKDYSYGVDEKMDPEMVAEMVRENEGLKKNPFEMRLFGKKMLGLRGLLWKLGLLNLESELNERLTRGGREAADEMFGYMDEKAQGGRVGMYGGGGIADLDMTGGGASFGPGTGTSDDIPAMLSDGEFVVTANAVKNLGGGDRMLGARKMYQMMNQLDPNSQTPAEMNTVGIA